MSCFFIATSWNKGAVSQQFVGLARELARRGHRAVVLVTGELRDPEDHRGNPAVLRWPNPRPVTLADAAFLARMIRRERPACVVGNFSATNVMLLVGSAMRVPVRVAWYHTLFDANAGNSALPNWRFRALQIRKAITYRAATHHVANSDAARVDLVRHFRVSPTRCSVIYNSIPDPFPTGDLAPPRDPNKVVCVSGLSPMKGQRTLIEALARLEHRAATVTFVGAGPMAIELEQLAVRLGVRERCHFAGYRTGPEVVREYLTSTASVVPSLSEAFGLVNLESLALRTPLVVSATGGSVEVARDEQEALHFVPGDARSLAAQLDRVLADPALRRGLTERGRARFEQLFEQTTATRRLADWLEGITP